MNGASWVLFTQCFAMFPILVFMWSWKRRRDAASVFMWLRFIFCVSFSLCYHTYDIESIPTIREHEGIWTLLDGYASTSLIFTTTCYGFRVRPPQFYILVSTVDAVILLLYLFSYVWYHITWMLILVCAGVLLAKWRTGYRYILKFPCTSLTTCSFATMSILSLCIAVQVQTSDDIYTFWHSLWHGFIFCTAGSIGVLRYKLDEQLYPMNRRETLDSI